MAVPENWRVKLKKTEIFTEIVEYDNDNHKEQPQNDKKKIIVMVIGIKNNLKEIK